MATLLLPPPPQHTRKHRPAPFRARPNTPSTVGRSGATETRGRGTHYRGAQPFEGAPRIRTEIFKYVCFSFIPATGKTKYTRFLRAEPRLGMVSYPK